MWPNTEADLQHSSVGNLELAESLTGRQNVCDAGEAHDVSHGEENFGQDLRVEYDLVWKSETAAADNSWFNII